MRLDYSDYFPIQPLERHLKKLSFKRVIGWKKLEAITKIEKWLEVKDGTGS